MSTIRDIAKTVRVSVSTVSLALNGDARVRASTRDRILAVAHELDYRPNRAARSLSSGKAWTLDVINPAIDASLSSSFSTRFLHGIHDTARAASYGVSLQIVNDEEEAVRVVRHLILEHATDGLVLMNPSDDRALVEHLAQARFPYVVLGRVDHPSARSVDNDNVAVGADATAALLDKGLDPILFLTGPERSTMTIDRTAGHVRALAERRPGAEPVVRATDGTATAARRRVRDMLSDGIQVRSVLALHDGMAVGALRGVRDVGLAVPADIAVMGMNNDDLTEFTDPALSSVELHAYELGRRSAEALLAAIDDPASGPSRVQVAHELIFRESV